MKKDKNFTIISERIILLRIFLNNTILEEKENFILNRIKIDNINILNNWTYFWTIKKWDVYIFEIKITAQTNLRSVNI